MKKLLTISVAVLAVIAIATQVVNVFISNTVASDSVIASRLENEIDKVTENNIELKDDVLSYASYNTIASRAAELGYVDSKDIVSVYNPVNVASAK